MCPCERGHTCSRCYKLMVIGWTTGIRWPPGTGGGGARVREVNKFPMFLIHVSTDQCCLSDTLSWASPDPDDHSSDEYQWAGLTYPCRVSVCVCGWVGGWWWSLRRRSMSWEKSDAQQRPRFPDFLCLTRFSLHERRNRIKMTPKNVYSIWKTSKASINIIKKKEFWTTERINGVNVAQWIQD